MRAKYLGNTAIEISPMGFGAWAIGGEAFSGADAVGWGKVDDGESKATIQAALDNGIKFFDTANVYGAGHSETVLGDALKPVRDRVVIATKVGVTFDPATRQLTGENAGHDYILKACDESLARLQTDVIDLYQFHLNGYDENKVGPVVDAFEKLVAAGKIRAYGWSTDFVPKARTFLSGAHNASVQFQNNVVDSNREMMRFCEANKLSGINRGPLAMGLLTGKFSTDSSIGEGDVRGTQAPSWMTYFKDGKPNPDVLDRLEKIKEILRSGGRSLSQGALAWLWGASERNIPIPGIRTVKQAEENAKAMEFGPLTPEQISEIDSLLQS